MIRLQDVLKTFFKTSWRRFEDVFKTSWRRFCKKSWRRLENVLKMSWKRIAKTNILVLTKTSSEDIRLRWTYLSWSRRLLKTKTKDVFKTSSRRLHQDECLLGDIFHIVHFGNISLLFLVFCCWLKIPPYQFINAEITYCAITHRCTKILVK